MPKKVFQQSPETYEERMTWRIRWYLVIILTTAYVASLIAGFIGFFLTKDPYYLAFITPTALIPFVHYLVPMDKKRYELQLAKIQAQQQRPKMESGQILMPLSANHKNGA